MSGVELCALQEKWRVLSQKWPPHVGEELPPELPELLILQSLNPLVTCQRHPRQAEACNSPWAFTFSRRGVSARLTSPPV